MSDLADISPTFRPRSDVNFAKVDAQRIPDTRLGDDTDQPPDSAVLPLDTPGEGGQERFSDQTAAMISVSPSKSVSSKTGLPGFVPPSLDNQPSLRAPPQFPLPERSQSRLMVGAERSQSRSFVGAEQSQSRSLVGGDSQVESGSPRGSSLRSSLRLALPPRIKQTHGGSAAAIAEREQQEQMQNATSLALLQEYFVQQPGVPVDWRNGQDMRTLHPAQAFTSPRKQGVGA